MIIRYLFLFWGLTSSILCHAQSPGTYALCWVELTDKKHTEHGYELLVTRPKNAPTTLTIYYPWAEAKLNPRYIIHYNPQGDGTWQEHVQPPQAVRVSFLKWPTRWRIAFDSTEYIIYTTKKRPKL